MPAIIARILVFLAGLFGSGIGAKVAQWVAFKAFMLVLITIVLPIVLNKIIYALIERGINKANASVSLDPFIVQFTGIGGWLASNLRLPEALSIVLACVAARFTLRVMRVM